MNPENPVFRDELLERIRELEAVCVLQRDALKKISVPNFSRVPDFIVAEKALSIDVPKSVVRIELERKFVQAYRNEPLTVLKDILNEIDELEKQ